MEALQKEKGGLITEEEREKGAVKLQVYMVWAYAAGEKYDSLTSMFVVRFNQFRKTSLCLRCL